MDSVMEIKNAHSRYMPFILTIAIIILDQLSKAWVVAAIPLGVVYASWADDFIWICHVRNTAIGFSIGHSLPETVKLILFVLVPLILMVYLSILLARSNDLVGYQRWLLGAVIGGGLGNIIDRIFRPGGVVDFISVKVYGLFGYERWPTFNIADSAIVVAGILLIIHMLFAKRNRQEKELSHE